MKKLLLLVTILSLNVFAQDSIKDQVINKKIQENISLKIKMLESIDVSKTPLSEFVQAQEEQCLANAKSEVVLEQTCFDNTERLYAIGDLETIIDMDIARLTEYQTSFVFTMLNVWALDEASSFGEYALFITTLPLAVTADIILTPFYIFALMTY